MKKQSEREAPDEPPNAVEDEEQLVDGEQPAASDEPAENEKKEKKSGQTGSAEKDKIIELEEVSAKAPVFHRNAMAVPVYDENRNQSIRKVSRASALEEERKLELLKKKVSQTKKNKSMVKKRSKRQRVQKVTSKDKPKEKAPVPPAPPEQVPEKPKESKVVKKTLGDRLRNKFKAVTNFFSLGSVQAQKAQKRAQAKISSPSIRKIADGDDAMPVAGAKVQVQISDIYDDVWIEDPAVLTNREHRSDLVIVFNNDNNGQLWQDGKRPFWKDKALQREVPPAPSEKPVSKLLVDVISNKTPLADPAPEPTLDELASVSEMKSKDSIWFQEEHVLANTIRSIVGTTTESVRPQSSSIGLALRKLTINEPNTAVTYYRHNNVQKDTVPFTKSPYGKAKKIKGRSSPRNSSVSTSSSSSSSKERRNKA